MAKLKLQTIEDFMDDNFIDSEDADVMKSYCLLLLDKVYQDIKHGDDEHQKWLYDKIEDIKKQL